MIVYGTKATLLKSEFIYEPCPNCKTANSVQVNVYQRYAHIFWIPFFPVGKTGVSVCNHCKQVLKLKQMPSSLQMSYENLKTHTKTPIWNFSGIALVILIGVAVTISEKQKAEKVSKLVLSPQKGDIFELMLKSNAYTLYKVQSVEGDTVFFFANKYETNQETGLSDLVAKGDSAFDTEMTYGLSKSELTRMNKRDEIIDIDRK